MNAALRKTFTLTVELTNGELAELKADLTWLLEDNRASEATHALLLTLEED